MSVANAPIRSARLVCSATFLLFAMMMQPVLGASFHIDGDAGDGALQHIPTLGQQDAFPVADTARVGVGGAFPNRANINAIYLFELPDISGGSLMDAEFFFTFVDGENSFGVSDLDVWGLGYVTTPTLDPNWLYVGDSDPDPGVNITTRQKIQDDVVGAVPDPNGTPVHVSISDTGNANLVAFIQSLYSQGAQAGDYAIIRLNDDRANPDPNAGGTGGYRVGFSEYAGPVPELGLFDATVIDWIAPGSGDYATSSNWSPSNVPDNSPGAETARFNVSLPLSFDVKLPGGSTVTVTDLLIDGGQPGPYFSTENSATADAVYNVNDQVILNGGLTVGDSPSGFDVVMNVTNDVQINDSGTLRVDGATVSVGGAITMSSSSTFHLRKGALTASSGLDNSADGTFTHEDGTLTVTGGPFIPNSVGTYSIDGLTATDNPHLILGAGATADFSPPLVLGTTLIVGLDERGVFTIEGGAQVSSNISSVGLNPGSNGAITVNGLGSTLTNTGRLTVGSSGHGTLVIEAGGQVSSSSGSIAGLGGSTGMVTVTGADSMWNSSGFLFIGDSGQAELRIEAGGQVSNTTGIIGFDDGSGVVTVTGEGSTWTNSGALFVGSSNGAGGTGHLTVADRGLVEAGDTLSILESSAVTLNGGTIALELLVIEPGGTMAFNFGTLNFTGDLGIAPDDQLEAVLGGSHSLSIGQVLQVDGTTTLNDVLTVDGGTLLVGSLVNPQLIDLKRGTLNINNQAVSIEAGGPFGDTLDVREETTINVALGVTNHGIVKGNGSLGGLFTNAADGELQGLAGNILQLTGDGNTNDGQVTLSGGEVHFTQDFTNIVGGLVIGNGTLRADGGTTNDGDMAFSATANVIGDVTNNATGLVISAGGTTTFFDDVINNGEIRTSANSFTVHFGSRSGAGDTGTGTVIIEGDLKPGSSPGVMAFGGDLMLGDAAETQIEIAGLSPGSEFDQITVADEVTLDGDLLVSLLGGFIPELGDAFSIISAASVTGNFDSINPPAGADFELRYTPTTVELVATSGLPGDYNNNGTVDAADYAVWLADLGAAAGTLLNDVDGGLISLAQYQTWRSNFGAALGPQSNSTEAAVPEPNAGLLVLLSFAASVVCRCRTARLAAW